MFKVLQTDPETAAIHLNESAVLRHRFGERFLRIFDEFFVSGTPHSVLRSLYEMPISDERTSLVKFTSEMLHELKHYADLVFTPYGFYRLRVAFEFYSTNISHLLKGPKTRLPVPLVSGSDPTKCRQLGLHEYAGTDAMKLSDLALGRAKVIEFDNQKYEFGDGTAVSLGGDAILEARAFETQGSWLWNLLSEDCLGRYESYFAEYAGTAFDLKYRWYTAIASHLKPEPDLSTARLTQCLLFASLCGAFARDAKYSFHKLSSPVPILPPGRDIDDCLPSNRLWPLVEHFKKVGVPASSEWEVLLAVVDEACRSLWGHTFTEEIEEDIASDERSAEWIRIRMRLEDDAPHPRLAFENLIDIRRGLLKKFRSDPVPFVDSIGFVSKLGPMLSPQIIRIHPQGLTAGQTLQALNARTIHTEILSIPWQDEETGEEVVQERHVTYAYWLPILPEDTPHLEQNLLAWESVFSILAPLYKGLLYGHRSRSMLEFAVAEALAVSHFAEKLVWDPDFRPTGDISPTDDYFDFYELESAQCDLCSRTVDRNGSVYISGLTFRQNLSLLEHLYLTRDPTFIVLLLLQDKGGWLICREESVRWGFLRSN